MSCAKHNRFDGLTRAQLLDKRPLFRDDCGDDLISLGQDIGAGVGHPANDRGFNPMDLELSYVFSAEDDRDWQQAMRSATKREREQRTAQNYQILTDAVLRVSGTVVRYARKAFRCNMGS